MSTNSCGEPYEWWRGPWVESHYTPISPVPYYPSVPPIVSPPVQGWQCPCCLKAHAPWMPTCPCAGFSDPVATNTEPAGRAL